MSCGTQLASPPAMSSPKSPRGVILDVDGTLVDSNDAHARAWVSALGESNIFVQLEAVRRLIGMGGDKLLPAVAGIEEDSALGQRIGQRRSEIFKAEYLPTLRAFPRVRELLQRMKAAGSELAVASSAKEEELEPLLAIANVKDLLEETMSSDDAERSKPDPDIVKAALNALGLPAADVLMIGDTPYDVEAASKIGVRTLALRCGGRSDEDLRGALAIFDSPAALLDQFDESPLAAAPSS